MACNHEYPVNILMRVVYIGTNSVEKATIFLRRNPNCITEYTSFSLSPYHITPIIYIARAVLMASV